MNFTPENIFKLPTLYQCLHNNKNKINKARKKVSVTKGGQHRPLQPDPSKTGQTGLAHENGLKHRTCPAAGRAGPPVMIFFFGTGSKQADF